MRGLLRGVFVLASWCALAAFGQEKPLWRMETWPGAQPAEGSRENLRGRRCEAPCLVWEEGGAPVFLREADPYPLVRVEGRSVAVRILDPQGAPAPGVRVAWKVEGWPLLPAPWGERPSDSEGIVVFRVPRTETVTLWVNEEAWAPGPVTVPPEAAEAVMVLDPAPAGSLRILDPVGRPVAGARLITLPGELLADPLATTRVPGFGLREVQADAFGRVRAPQGGEDAVGWLLAPGFRLKEWEGPSKGTIRLDPVPSVRLLFRPDKDVKVPERLTVRTVGRVPGIPWAPLALVVEAAPPQARVFPFAKGVAVEVTGEGLEAVLLDGLDEQEGKTVEVPLRKGMRLGGVVLSELGAPVAGVPVGVEELPRKGAYWTRTDEAGRFLLASLPKGSWSLSLRASGFREAVVGPYGPEDRLDLRLTLRRGARVRGSVGEQEAEPCRVLLKATSLEEGGARQQDVAISEDGTFEVGGLGPGEYRLLAWCAQKGRASVAFTLTEGEEKDLGVLAFEASPRVAGKVEGPDGEPWDSGADVELKSILKAADAATAYPPRILTTRTDAEGTFSFPGVPEGRYEIRAASGGHASQARKIEVDGEDVEVGTLVLKSSGSLSGILVSRTGKSFEGWGLVLKTQAYDPSAPQTTAQADGSFDFDEVPPGSYRLEVYDGQGPGPRATRTVRVEEGRDLFLQWPMEGVSFTAFLRIAGQPAAGATLVVEPASEGFEEGGLLQVSGGGGATLFGLPSRILRAKADQAGFVAFSEATPGPANASLYWEGAQYVAPVEVPDREGAQVSWNFTGVPLEGRVVDASGAAAPGATVSYAYEGVGESPARALVAGSDGEFAFPSMGAGRLLLTARGEGGRKGSLAVEVKDRPLSGLLIRLQEGAP